MKKPELNITTGEHKLTRMEPADGYAISNQLFLLTNSRGKQIGFTGEELTSLANQWLKFAASWK